MLIICGTPAGLTNQTVSRQENCHPLLFHSVSNPCPPSKGLDYLLTGETPAQNLHCSHNEVQTYQLGMQSPSQSGWNLPLQLFVFSLQSFTKIKEDYLLFDPNANTFQPPAFVYDIFPSSFPPSVVERAWCLKTTESNAQPKHFQVM